MSESGVHEKLDLGLPEAFHKRLMREFGGMSGVLTPPPPKMNL